MHPLAWCAQRPAGHHLTTCAFYLRKPLLRARGVGAHRVVERDQRILHASKRSAAGSAAFTSEVRVGRGGEGLEFADDIRVLVSHVVLFANVVTKMIQLVPVEVQLPRAGADRVQREAAIIQERIARVSR